MTNRERVTATLKHKQPDKIPYNIFFTKAAQEKMVKYYNDPDFESKLGCCYTYLDTEPKNSWREIGAHIRQDQFGVQWDRSVDKDIGVVCNCLVTPENIDEYKFPNPDEPSRYQDYDKVIAGKPDGFFVSTIGFSLFERAWTLSGMENLMIYMLTDKDFVHKLLDRILEFNLKVINNATRHKIDVMMFGDDWGQQTGLLMGKKLWDEFIKPRVRQMYQEVKKHGKYVQIHSCGKVDELFPDLIECGLDVFNPFQPEVMDVFEMKKKFGDKLSFFGGISTQKTLPYGTVQQVKDEVKKLLDIVGKNGGYIASPAHSVPADAKPENIAAMIEAFQNQ